MEEYIDLCHYKTQEKVTVKAKKTGKEGQYLAHCINPDHEDKHASMGINTIKGEYNCLSRQDAKGVTWERHLREKGKGYKQKSNKKLIQETEDKEIKSSILTSIDTDIENWEGYDETIKEEVRTNIPFDLCFLPESERGLVMGAITKAGIFRITELRGRVKKALNELKKQKEKIKTEGEKKEKGPILKTFPLGLIHLVNNDGVKKYLFKNEAGNLVISETWTDVAGVIYKPRQDLPMGYASIEVLNIDKEINWAFLLRDIEKYIKSHLELPGKIYYLTFGLWIMHTYLMEKTDLTPYLYFVGLKATGKSRAGKIACKLAYKCFPSVLPSPAVVFRASDYFQNALVIDEAKFWGSDMDKDLARIILSRYERGMTVPRINMDKKGERQIELHNVFGPLIICTETNIPEPMEDRSIKIQMQRNISESVEDDWDKTEEQRLIDLLTLFRARYYNEEFPQHKRIARRRLGQILSPLYKILLLADGSRTEEFKGFIKEEETGRKAEEATSENATIISIFIDLYNEGRDYVLTQNIAKRYNQEIDNLNFQLSDRSMGWKIKPFNFKKKSIQNKAGWIIDRKTLVELRERFSIETEITPINKHNEKVQGQIQLDMPD